MKTNKLVLLVALFALPALAQKESLLIGPGDMVHVQVFDTPELEVHVRVTDAGLLTLALGGAVKVTGLTPSEAARVIEEDYKQANYMLNPHVTVTIEQYATQNVSISGQVRSPGSYPINTPRTVVDVIALAGGITDAADRAIAIQRHESKQKIAYFLSNSPDKALDDNVLVYPGDTVLVPKTPLVYVLGDVGRPGGYPWSGNDSQLSVLQAVGIAGGLQPTAAANHARLVRKRPGGTYVELDLHLAEMEKGKKPDIPLQADDILYIPFSYMRNIAVGAGGLISAASSAAIYRF